MLTDKSKFDVIVIGGGINGAAIAREAQLAGYKVLLVERDDFCAGTSATSTRLIHGGLRYLEHAEFSLVYESLREREQLLKTAPHLVEPLEIYLPLTRGARRGPTMIRLGMWLYDLLSIRKSLPSHRMLSADRLMAALPGLDRKDIVGGAAYFDAQVRFPERLVLEIALDARANGATLAPGTNVTGILSEQGKVTGVQCEVDGQRVGAQAPVVVNAAGPWVDSVLGSLEPGSLIGGTKGSHLITTAFAGAPASAVYAEARSDGRPFFVIPWNGLYLIGTTDVRYTGDPAKVAMSADELEYLVGETQRLFPGATDLREHVCYTCSGIRPLPATEGVREGAITRRHIIRSHANVEGLFSIIGGKLTTHRSLAVDCVKAIGRLRRQSVVSRTIDRALPGALDAVGRDDLQAALEARFGSATSVRLWKTYGGLSAGILDSIGSKPELGQRLGPDSDYLVAELVRGIEHEYASSLIDLLQRRTMAGLAADFGRRTAPLAADWLVRLGVWNKTKAAEELASYQRFAARHMVGVS
jgi:glycerol-3-phosphate dehydrogenase